MGADQHNCGSELFCDVDDPTMTPVIVGPELLPLLGKAKTASVPRNRLDALGLQAHRWARSSPSDPRIPELLHRFVRASRRASIHYSATKSTGQLSKKSFELLHSKYKETTWAKQTKYWYQ